MKTRRYLVLFLLFETLVGIGRADAQDDGMIWSVQYRVGWTRYALTELRVLLNEAVASYNASGVQVAAQVAFPGNVQQSGELTARTGLLRLGVGYTASNTLGFGAYRDEAGRMRVKAAVDVAIVYGIAGFVYEIGAFRGGIGHLSVKVGSLGTEITTEEMIVFTDFPEYFVDRKLTRDENTLVVGIVTGFSALVIGPVSIDVEAGYRYADLDAIALWSMSLIRPLDFSGFEGNVGLGIRW